MKGITPVYHYSYPQPNHAGPAYYSPCWHLCPCWANAPIYCPDNMSQPIQLRDYGPEPFAVNIEAAAKQNDAFRAALWTGEHLQLTLMSIGAGDDIGWEMHPDVDQFLRIEQGQGLVLMGDERDNPEFRQRVYDGCAVLIPAGKWHNLINTGCAPLKLYSIYAPPQHPRGTVHNTKADAGENHAYRLRA